MEMSQALILQGVLLHQNTGEGKSMPRKLQWETLFSFFTGVRIEPDSLLHNFSDKNLEAGVLGICMRTSTQRIIFICEYSSIRLSKRERSFTVLLCFLEKMDFSLYPLQGMNHDTCNQNKQTITLLSH